MRARWPLIFMCDGMCFLRLTSTSLTPVFFFYLKSVGMRPYYVLCLFDPLVCGHDICYLGFSNFRGEVLTHEPVFTLHLRFRLSLWKFPHSRGRRLAHPGWVVALASHAQSSQTLHTLCLGDHLSGLEGRHLLLGGPFRKTIRGFGMHLFLGYARQRNILSHFICHTLL